MDRGETKMLEKIPKSLAFVLIVFLILASLSNLNLITEAAKTRSSTGIATPDPSLTVTARTNKDTYLLRQRVEIDGNITQDGSPATDLVVIIQAADSLNSPIAYRTLTLGNPAPTIPWAINITSVFLEDLMSNPINTIKPGAQFLAGITIYNEQGIQKNVFVTLTVFDANMVPIQVGVSNVTVDPLSTLSSIFTINMPKWACSGAALLCGDVYSNEPKLGGAAYSEEKTGYFCISKTQQGLFEYQDLPPPPPQTTPGFFTTYVYLPPDPRAGQYTVYITSQDSPIQKSSTTTTFNVAQSSGYPPQASFAFWPAVPYLNQTVNFDASFSTPEGFGDQITSYKWDFGDGTKITKTTPTITHAYLTAKTYTVTLNVTDNEGLWSTTSKPLTVILPPGPKANFTWTPTSPFVGFLAQFNASNTQLGWSSKTQGPCPIKNYLWDFSEGGPIMNVTTPTISHAFANAGNFSVHLTVVDADGRQDTISYLVQVRNQTAHPWDVDGNGIVDMRDMWAVQKHFGETPSSPHWDPRADVDSSGRVDMVDMFTVQRHFGERY
jgi:PKD repeat protein